MLGIATNRLCRAGAQLVTGTRNTWVLRRVYAPEPTLPGSIQRPPTELPNLQKLEVVDFETKRAAGPIKVILLQDIEGIGHQFDIVDVDRRLARTDLLLTRKAVYASPFDLKYYAAMKESMADELAARVRIPFELVSVGRQLQKLIVPLRVSMEQPWTLDHNVLKTSLRQVGVDMTVSHDCLFIAPDQQHTGPNFDIEAKLVRFYVVVNKQYIVPMLGRISHISVDESKQVLTPEQQRVPSEAELARHRLRKEEPYFHAKGQDIDETFGVVEFMKNR